MSAALGERIAGLERENAYLRRQLALANETIEIRDSYIANYDHATKIEREDHEKALAEERERLDWLEQSQIEAEVVSAIVNGFLFDGKYYGSLRKAIDAARSAGEPK